MKKVANILIAVTFISTQLFAQQTPGNVQKEAITLLGGIAHIGNGTIIKNSAIIFEDGIIKACVDADKSRIYAILPNGTSVKYETAFFGLGSKDLMPGSTIIVPRKARPLDSLALVETVLPILANLSVTAASIAAISNNK